MNTPVIKYSVHDADWLEMAIDNLPVQEEQVSLQSYLRNSFDPLTDTESFEWLEYLVDHTNDTDPAHSACWAIMVLMILEGKGDHPWIKNNIMEAGLNLQWTLYWVYSNWQWKEWGSLYENLISQNFMDIYDFIAQDQVFIEYEFSIGLAVLPANMTAWHQEWLLDKSFEVQKHELDCLNDYLYLEDLLDREDSSEEREDREDRDPFRMIMSTLKRVTKDYIPTFQENFLTLTEAETQAEKVFEHITKVLTPLLISTREDELS